MISVVVMVALRLSPSIRQRHQLKSAAVSPLACHVPDLDSAVAHRDTASQDSIASMPSNYLAASNGAPATPNLWMATSSSSPSELLVGSQERVPTSGPIIDSELSLEALPDPGLLPNPNPRPMGTTPSQMQSLDPTHLPNLPVVSPNPTQLRQP